jgi:hypothetical protein
MSIKKIAAIFLTVGASVAFAGAANAAPSQSQGINTTYTGGISSTCSISYGNATGALVNMTGTNTQISGQGSYRVTCNDPGATVTLTEQLPTFNGSNTLPSNVTATSSVTNLTSDFNGTTTPVAAGTSINTNSGALTANGDVTVTAKAG